MIITEAAVKHRVSIYVLIGVLLLAGGGTYASLPREAAPEIDIPVVLVTVPYFGVSPEDIESLVTRPLERELKEVQDIDELVSTSAQGASIISVQFETDADLTEALQEVREKVDLAKPNLPPDAEEPQIKSINTTDFPMMIINLSATYSLVRLRQVAEDLQEKLEVVPGVLDAKLAGGLEREIQVQVDPMRLNHYGISLQEVEQAIDGSNINMPGGNIDIGDASFLVRVPAEFEHLDELKAVPIKLRGGSPIYVRDVAQVVDGFKDKESISRLDGKSNVSLTITKRAGANLIDMAAAIKLVLAKEEVGFPAGTDLTILGDESNNIRDMVKELENNMATGLLLVLLVIMIAMGLRNSLVVGAAIPLSMLVTFLALGAMGITLNMVVLFSLILALGMLVDNAIVIVENVYRHACEGKGPAEAAIAGTAEVAWPVFTSTLTTVAAFGPLVMWPGVDGKFMAFLPKTVIITLFASLFVALIITPVLCASFLRPKKNALAMSASKANALANNRWSMRYRSFLAACLRHPGRTSAVGLCVFIGTFVVFSAAGLGVEFFPEVTPKKIFLEIDTGDGTRLGSTDAVTAWVEKRLQGEANIDHYVANVGTSGSGSQNMGGASRPLPHRARVSIDFIDAALQTTSVEDTMRDIRLRTGDIPGARVEMEKQSMGPPVGKPIAIEVYGDEIGTLAVLSRKIQAEIRDIPGLVDLKDDYSAGKPELQVSIDRERAGTVRAPTGMIASTVRTAMNGSEASVFREGDDEYDITVRLDKRFRKEISDLESLMVNVASRTNPDEVFLIPLRAVAKIVPGGGIGSIKHKDTKRVITIVANVEERFPADVLADVRARLGEMDFPAGYFIAYGGQDEKSSESQAFLINAFLITLFLIALILVTQFNSIFLPTIIILSVVLSLVGVLWGQMLTQMPFGIVMTGLGVISLAGVVVNNGIVLVDYIQQLRGQGVARNEALLQAGLVRLRPVLLTAVTTILGLVPMALGIGLDFSSFSVQAGGQTAAFWKPMAIAVIFGLAIATVLTLVVVPVLYIIFDSLEQRLIRFAERRRSRGGMEGAA